ncbi:MAG: hypothetical protein WDW38_011474 [Sanguina aurantia]
MGLLEGLPCKVAANFSLVTASEGRQHNKRLQVYLKTSQTTGSCVQATTTDTSTDALIRLIKGRTAVKPATASDPATKRACSGEGAAGPSKKPRPPAASGPTAGTTPEEAGGASGAKPMYAADELKAKTGKELSELLKARLLPSSGVKDLLIRRILEAQRSQKAHPHFQ